MAIVKIDVSGIQPDVVTYPVSARHFLFRKFQHTVTPAEAAEGILEWWFPQSNGQGRNSLIHNATLIMENGPPFCDSLRLWLLSPCETQESLIADLDKLAKVQNVGFQFIIPTHARGVLKLEGPRAGVVLTAQYLVERVG